MTALLALAAYVPAAPLALAGVAEMAASGPFLPSFVGGLVGGLVGALPAYRSRMDERAARAVRRHERGCPARNP